MQSTDLEAVVTVLQQGSFTRAAERLGVDKAALSRQVSAFEARLGTRLIARTTRSLAPTEAGRLLLARGEAVLAELAALEAEIEGLSAAPSGRLRLTCGEEFGQLVVTRWIAAMLASHPQVSIAADFTNRVVDIVQEGIDLAIRVGPLRVSGLVAIRLGEIGYGVYGGTGYLAARGTPAHPADLAGHDLIVFTPAGEDLVLTRNAERVVATGRTRLAVNNNWVATEMVARDLGLAILPNFQVARHPLSAHIRPILAGWGRPAVPVSAVTTGRRYRPPKTEAFIALARRDFAQGLWG